MACDLTDGWGPGNAGHRDTETGWQRPDGGAGKNGGRSSEAQLPVIKQMSPEDENNF